MAEQHLVQSLVPPNNTHDALNWLMTIALVHLVPQNLRSRIKCVFTDHCGIMTPILAKVCGDKDVFPNARHFLCVYHVVRNFFQDFGQGHNKRWNLKNSTQKYRKGGHIEWAYAWQKNCASAVPLCTICPLLNAAPRLTHEIDGHLLRAHALRFWHADDMQRAPLIFRLLSKAVII